MLNIWVITLYYTTICILSPADNEFYQKLVYMVSYTGATSKWEALHFSLQSWVCFVKEFVIQEFEHIFPDQMPLCKKPDALLNVFHSL